jgi:hypothetical protein
VSRKSRIRLLSLATLATLALVPAAAPAGQPLLTLGAVTIANGTATVAGTLGPQASGSTVTVNGRELTMNTSGAFAGTVALKGASSIDLALSRPDTGVTTHYQVPIQGQTVIPGSVIDPLTQAGLSIAQPVAKSGRPVTVTGSLADGSQLIGLSINGVDTLGLAQQGGSFTVQLPGDTGQVQVTANGVNGTTETIDTPVFRPFSTTTVSAGSAVGIRITKIRYIRKGAVRAHRIRMIVTVRDRRGRLIRGATIRVTAKGHKLAKRPRATRSRAKGRATIPLRLRTSAYGKRLITVTLAKTPRAKARKTSAVRVPAKH